MGWFVFSGLLFVVSLIVAFCQYSDKWREPVYQIREDRLIQTTGSTIDQATEEQETTDVWVRYDVPLDDDLQKYIYKLCSEYKVDPALVMAVIEVESGFDPEKSGDGGKSLGLMQIYSTQHTERCIRLDAWNLFEPKANVRVGIDFLSELMATGHDIEWCLSWYNGHGGDSCEYSKTVLNRAEIISESAMIMEG